MQTETLMQFLRIFLTIRMTIYFFQSLRTYYDLSNEHCLNAKSFNYGI